MKTSWIRNSCAAAALLGMSVTAVSAQDSQWNYAASIYLFGSETTMDLGPIESELSFRDALDNLDFAFMGAFEASKGQWSFLLDYMFTDLGLSGSTPGNVFTGSETDLKMQILSGYAAYRVFENETASIDLAGGFRYFETKTEMTLVGGPPVGSVSTDADWIDPLVAVRANVNFSDRWSGTGMFDYGGFGGDSQTWQVLLTGNYAINEKWELRGGYRVLEVANEINGVDLKINQSGPIFGATYRF